MTEMTILLSNEQLGAISSQLNSVIVSQIEQIKNQESRKSAISLYEQKTNL
ncbi:hypothetical protein IGI46_000870 [Enterococcus sp. AZ163]